MHCALAMCQNNDRRDVYEVLRRVYNLVRPAGWKFVMPFEEWTSMRDICDHMFCRCVWARTGIVQHGRTKTRSLSLRAVTRA